MHVGVRGKLMIVALVVIACVAVPLGFAVSSYVRGWLLDESETDLARTARVMQEAIAQVDRADRTDWDALGELASRVATSAEMRVTLIDASGATIADSADGAPLENRAGRPEVRRALAGEVGRSTRYSTTVGADLLYVAIPAEFGDGHGAIRVARSLSRVETAVGRARLFVIGVFSLMSALALLASALVAQRMIRTLRTLIDSARALGRGEARRAVVSAEDELGSVASSVNALARELEDTVEALAKERARFALVLESMSEAVVALDGGRRVTLHNRAARALLGAEGDLVGRPLIEIVRAPALLALLDDAAAGKHAENEFVLPGGRSVLARATPQQGGGGCVIVLHDVTELRRLETVRRDFVANVSHELRTPVSVVRANAETLQDGALEDAHAAPALLGALFRNAERLASLVADLLDLSRLEAGKFRLEPTPVDVRDAAERARAACAAAAESRGATACAIEIDVEPGAVVMADPRALDQILENLGDNAVKYSGEGKRVAIRGRREGDAVVIEVIDDGPGIPAAERPRIFERFYRLDPGRSRELGGTGLGLSIVKHLAESMGGSVGVRGGSSRGAVFWVRLPVAGSR